MTFKFNDGDIVTLASGGPLMTAEPSSRTDGVVVCRWFVGNDLITDSFPAECLRLVSAREEE